MTEWAIREAARGADDAGIHGLLRRCYSSGGVTWERFQHWYGGLEGSKTSILVADAGDQIIGMQPIQFIRHCFHGRPLTAGVFTGVMVDPAWRRRGVFQQLITACEQLAFGNEAELVWTMPNARSLPGFKRLGYTLPGERRLFVWSGRCRELLERRFGAAAGRWLGLPAGAVMGRRRAVPSGLLVRDVDELSEESLSLAAADSAAFEGLVQERSREWLRWRFGDGMGFQYRFVEVVRRRDDQVLAWAAVTSEQREGLDTGYVVDFAGCERPALATAVAQGLQLLAERGSVVVMCVASGKGLRGVLSQAGMFRVPRPLAPKRFFLAARVGPGADPFFARGLKRIGAWRTTFADWDTL